MKYQRKFDDVNYNIHRFMKYEYNNIEYSPLHAICNLVQLAAIKLHIMAVQLMWWLMPNLSTNINLYPKGKTFEPMLDFHPSTSPRRCL